MNQWFPRFVRLPIFVLSAFLLTTVSCDRSTNDPVLPQGGDSTSASGVLDIGKDTTVQIDAGGSVRLSFQSLAQTTYRFEATGSSATQLVLRDSAGGLLVGTVSGSDIVWTSPAGGKVLLAISVSISSVPVQAVVGVSVINAPDASEPDGKLSQARSLPTDNSVRAGTLTPGDVDWVKLSIATGRIYHVSAVGSDTVRLQLFAADSTAQGAAQPGSLEFRAPGTGTVYIRMTLGTPRAFGSYSVRAWSDSTADTTKPDASEPDSTLHTAQLLSADSSAQNHTFTPGDVDWVKVPTAPGKYYRLAVAGSDSVGIQLFTSDSTPIGSVTRGAAEFKSPGAGFVYARLAFVSAASHGSYTVRAWADPRVGAYEPDDTWAQATWITTDSSVQTHGLALYDHDRLKFLTDSGKVYKLAVGETHGRSTGGVRFYVYSDTTMADCLTAGIASANFSAPRAGVVYLDISSPYGDTGEYTVAVLVDALADSGEPDTSMATAATVLPDSLAHRRWLTTGDVDWVKIPVADQGTYGVRCSYPAKLQVVSKDLVNIGGWGPQPNGENSFVANPGDGFVYLRIASEANQTGPYELRIWGGPPKYKDKYEPDDAPAQANLLPTDGSAQSHFLGTRDIDWVKFPTQAGKTYRVSVGQHTGARVAVYQDSSATRLLCSGTTSSLFKATRSGTMFLKFEQVYTNDTGAYTLSVSTDTTGSDLYEPDDAPAQATGITTDGHPQHHVFVAGDTDWVKFRVDSGVAYAVATSGSAGRSIHVCSDSILSHCAMGSDVVSLRAQRSGTFFANIASATDLGSSSASYDVAVGIDSALMDTKYEPDGKPSLGTSISTDGGAQHHALIKGDTDWVKFRVDSGVAYNITISAGSATSIHLCSDSGLSLCAQGNGTVSLKAPRSGTFFASITSTSDLGDLIQAYDVAIRIDSAGMDRYEPDDTRALATPISTDGVAQNHGLQVGDVDWVKFHADSGKRYQVQAGGPQPVLLSVFLDSTASSSNISTSSRTWFQASRTGAVFMKAVGTSISESGAYSIGVSVDTTGPGGDSGWAIPVGSDAVPKAARIPVGSSQWFRFTAEAGKAYNVTLGNLPGATVELVKASAQPGEPHPTGTSSASIWSPTGGTIYVKISGNTGSTDLVGSVSVVVDMTNVDPYEPDDDSTQAKLLELGVPQTHFLYFGEYDWMKLSLKAGTKYSIKATTSTSFSLALYDRSGAIASSTVTHAVSSGYPEAILYTPPADGIYYLQIYGMLGYQPGAYVVEVSVTPPQVPVVIDARGAGITGNRPTSGISRFTADSGSYYTFRAGLSQEPTLLTLMDADSAVFATAGRSDGGGSYDAPMIGWMCRKSGTYYMGVNAPRFVSPSQPTTTFSVSVSGKPLSQYADLTEPNNTRESAVPIPWGTRVDLVLGVNDTDWVTYAGTGTDTWALLQYVTAAPGAPIQTTTFGPDSAGNYAVRYQRTDIGNQDPDPIPYSVFATHR